MPYFFGHRTGDHVVIEGEDARHLARSLRVRPGELVSVVEPEGRLLAVRLETVTASECVGRIEQETAHQPEPGLRVTMALAMLPAAALEEALTRCTELGAARFVLVQARRSVGRGAKPERWAAICREASMLAGRLRVPAVEGPLPLSDALARLHRPVLLDARAERRLASIGFRDECALLIGPEGGWTEDERALVAERATLGPRNLRAENAAAAALAIVLREL